MPPRTTNSSGRPTASMSRAAESKSPSMLIQIRLPASATAR